MMNLKILRLTGVASALLAISLTQAAEEASPKTDGKNEPNTYQEKFMKRAIEISRTALTPGTEHQLQTVPAFRRGNRDRAGKKNGLRGGAGSMPVTAADSGE